MAIYFPNQVPSTGQKAGEAFAGGIGNVLNQLAHQKISQFQQRQQAQKMGGVFQALGLPAEIGQLPENLQQAFIKQHLAQPQQQALADVIGSLFGGGEQQQAQQPQESGMAQQQMQPQQEAPEAQQSFGPMTQQRALSSAMQGGLQPERIMQQKGPTQEQLRKLTPQQLTQVAGLGMQQKKIEEQKKQFMTKQELEREKINLRKQEHWDKETKPVYDEIVGKAKAATDSDMRLGRMEELNEGKGLGSPAFETALKFLEEGLPFGLHLNLSALRSADSAEFNKLSKDFLKDAKQFFGSKVTEGEIKLFLQTIPDLAMTAEGRRRIINNMRLFNEAARVRADVMDNIIQENGGERPRNLDRLVEARSKKSIDDIAQRFKLGIRESSKTKASKPENGKGLLGGAIDNPMDIVNALSGVKNRISGLFGYE